MLVNSHQTKDGIMLRAVAHPPSNFAEVFDRIDASYRDFSTRRHNIVCQTLEDSRFASTIDSKKSEALAVNQTEGNSFNSRVRLRDETCVALFVLVDTDKVLLIWTSRSRLLVKQGCRIGGIVVVVLVLHSEPVLLLLNIAVQMIKLAVRHVPRDWKD